MTKESQKRGATLEVCWYLLDTLLSIIAEQRSIPVAPLYRCELNDEYIKYIQCIRRSCIRIWRDQSTTRRVWYFERARESSMCSKPDINNNAIGINEEETLSMPNIINQRKSIRQEWNSS